MIHEILFWALILFVIYAYVGYPFILKILSFFLNKPINTENIYPHVSLIISAYNEEEVIRTKLENALELDYPEGKLEIIVASDGSTDGMEAISREYEAKGIRTVRIEGRVGKTICLNHVVPEAMGEILVFSDANSLYEAGSLCHMMKNFADRTIGFVSGHTKYSSSSGRSDSHETVSLYSRLERITKLLESKVGSCIGADGAMFAIRKSLYRPLREEDINDLVIPLDIISQGYRGILEKDAYCVEESASGKKREYQRQVRISNRTLRALFTYRKLFNIVHYGLISFELFSHKLAKCLVPYALLGLLLVNALLIRMSTFYLVLFVGQLIFYGAALWGVRRKEIRMPLRRVVEFSSSFVIVNLAILKGWLTLIRGEKFITWQKVR